MDAEPAFQPLEADTATATVKKPPRKPRPSEIAAKKAKVAKVKPKPKAKKKTPAKPRPKPKAKKKAVKKPAKRKVPAKSKRKLAKARGPERSERLDMRLSKGEKAKLKAIAKRKGIPITEVVWGAIAKLK